MTVLQRYLVQERCAVETFWTTVGHFECLEGAFHLICEQKALMRKGKRKFPKKAADYNREYRVVLAQTNTEVIWPSPEHIMPPAPHPSGAEGLDHMEDALRYVTQGIAATNMLRA